MRILELRGTPRDMGRQFGEACRDAIAEFYELRVQNAIRQAHTYGGRTVDREQVMQAARACVEPTCSYDPVGFEELTGIAEGANLSVDTILATNGLTDIRDILCWPGQLEALGGCSSFIAAADFTRDGEVYCGQTWDLATDNLPYVLGVHRKPDEGPETWCLTTVGCLSLIGLNDAGLAIGTTNIRCTDAQPGVTYLSIIHKALSCRTFAEARSAVVEAPRAGGHYYFLCGPEGQASALECTATQAEEVVVEHGIYVHTNHCLIPSNQALEGVAPQASSTARQARLEALILASRENTAESFMEALSDRSGGAVAINRDDINGINTNGAVIMAPESGRIWACHGLPDTGEWIALREARPL